MSDSICRSVVQPIARRLTAAGSGIGSSITYLSRLLTGSTTTPFYAGTTNIVDRSSTGDYREIQPGRCLEFNGTTQYVDLNSAFTYTGAFSISHWINLADISSEYPTVGNAGTTNWIKTIWNGTVIRVAVSGFKNWTVPAYAGGEWHHLVVTRDQSDNMRVYWDGNESSTGSQSHAGSFSFQYLGRRELQYWKGQLFDVRIYNRVLTDAEITALYRQGLQPDSVVEGQPDATNLVGRWLLDDNSQNTAYDSSGNGNHGTIVGYASGMLYEGDDVPYSQQNLVGYSEGASSTFVPRDESDIANDVLGNPLDYTGTVPKYATPVDAPCLTFNGTNQYLDISDPTHWTNEDWEISAWINGWDLSASFDYFSVKHATGGGGGLVLNYATHSPGRFATYFANQVTQFDQIPNAVENEWFYMVLSWNASVNELTLSVNGFSQTKTILSPFTTPDGDFDRFRVATNSNDSSRAEIRICNLTGPFGSLPMSEGDGNTVYDVVNGDSYTITSYASTMWTTATQDEFFYSFENGCRESSGVAIPALADGSAAADSNPLTGLPGLLNSDTYNLNLLPELDAPYQRSAIPGMKLDGVGDYVNAFGIPDSPSGNAVTDDPFSGRVIFKVNYAQPQPLICNGNRTGDGTGDRGIAWLVSQPSTGEIRLRLYDDSGGRAIWWSTPIQPDGEWITVDFEYDGVGGATITVNGVDQVLTPGAEGTYVAMHNYDQLCVGASLPGDSLYFSPSNTTIAYARLDGFFEYDFRENNGLVIPDRSGNGNHGTLVVNSSLDQIFAPTALETAYTLGDGRTRPHYVTEDSPNETDFRTEII
jgi:hypothetical protein